MEESCAQPALFNAGLIEAVLDFVGGKVVAHFSAMTPVG